ncbi:hypothetical protein B296_00008467 [Ensete ventricosum]|uniref:Aconitase/3-isopropylmalate dehydratase large subunit alpha/beta/alpha domain-containing protein n=1 Tax=Ensete ventricosum TaxID=4639 RepID=A0A427AR54_ENSVE|nr:hypothetical protein B296_00008467 [Ensete ventricosum]
MLYCYMSATENVFKDVLASLPKAGGGEYGKYYSLPALNDPRIGYIFFCGLQVPVDLVIDHSVQVDVARSENAVQANMEFEFQRNKERFGFLKWGSTAFRNMLVVPPGSGIVHQVNLEYLGRVVFNTDGLLYPDSVVGTDSHTTMIDGLGVAGWGVGGIEAEATMLGEGMGELSLADRATIANMSPEYGATMGFFPVDHVSMIEAYLRANKMFVDYNEQPQKERIYSSYLELDLADVEPCISGPKRFAILYCTSISARYGTVRADQMVRPNVPSVPKKSQEKIVKFDFHGQPAELKHGNLVIAAITSCTNTSNPNVMLGAGLVAKKACELGLQVDIDFEKEPIGTGKHGKSIYFKDIWPSTEEIAQVDTKTFSNYYM